MGFLMIAAYKEILVAVVLSVVYSFLVHLYSFRDVELMDMRLAYLLLFNSLVFLFSIKVRFIFVFVVPIYICLVGTIQSFLRSYSVRISGETFALLMETNLHEVSGVFNLKYLWEGVGWFLVSMAMVVCIHKYFLRKPARLSPSSLAISILLGGIIFLVPNSSQSIASSFPFSVYGEFLKYQESIAMISSENLEKRGFEEDSFQDTQDSDDMVVILVLTDSMRADKMQINGYPRPTNPLMIENGMVSFPKIYSCERVTRIAVPCMLTRASVREVDVSPLDQIERLKIVTREKSVVSIFDMLGYETYWISNNGLLDYHDTPTTAIGKEADHRFFNINYSPYKKRFYDVETLPILDKALEKGGKKFIVLHVFGNHSPYVLHYPPEREYFKPTCPGDPRNCNNSIALSNSYDNATRETDYFVNEVIKRVKDRKAFVMVASDHGEMLGEDNLYVHPDTALNRPEARFTFLSLWFSSVYKERYPFLQDIVKANAQKTIDHDYIFHSLLDCGGISGNLVDLKQSVCRAAMFESAYAEMKRKELVPYPEQTFRNPNREFSKEYTNFRFTQREWVHRVNSIERARILEDRQVGFEIDVTYNLSKHFFDVGHPPVESIGLDLSDLIASLRHPESHYYWIDFKNLNRENYISACETLLEILRKNDVLPKNVIVESTNPVYLKLFKKKGFYTSYYLPSFSPVELGKDDLDAIKNEIRKNIHLSEVDALSSNIHKLEFIEDNFPEKDILTWYGDSVSTMSFSFIRKRVLSNPKVQVLLIKDLTEYNR